MSAPPKPTLADAGSLPPTISVPVAAKWLSLGRGTAYQLARDGRLPGVLRLGSRYVVATAPLLRAIGIEPPKSNGKESQ
jgi:hypothetical protein